MELYIIKYLILKKDLKKIIGFIIFFVAFVIFILTPKKYDFSFNLLCSSVYWGSIAIYLVIKKKKNYFDFENLFFITYFFVTLFYIVSIYEINPRIFFMFNFAFNRNDLPLAASLAVLGMNSFLFGSLLVSDKIYVQKSFKNLKTKKLYIVSLILFFLYFLTGGYQKLQANYSGDVIEEGGVSSYFVVFMPAFLFSGIIIDYYNLKQSGDGKFSLKKLNKFGVIIASFICFALIATGSRTIPLQIILLYVGLYALLFRPIGLLKFLGFVFLGLTIMSIVRVVRGSIVDDTDFNFNELTMDLIINNRNTFAAIDIVRRNGFSYGESMLSPILAAFPLAQQLFIYAFDLDANAMASSLVITKDSLGVVEHFGLGTNIIADLYMAFGAPGVIILMIILGYLVNKSKININNIYYLVFYSILLSYAIYLVRAEYFFFLRYLVWSLIIVFIVKNKFKFS